MPGVPVRELVEFVGECDAASGAVDEVQQLLLVVAHRGSWVVRRAQA
ncbi:hypothetical protein AB0J01_38030 [Streptomyces sp. NPDC050204]